MNECMYVCQLFIALTKEKKQINTIDKLKRYLNKGGFISWSDTLEIIFGDEIESQLKIRLRFRFPILVSVG